jgi:competence protein ComEC
LGVDGEAILIKDGDVNTLIDCGLYRDSPKVVKYLKNEGVRTIDNLIITHPDSDHFGGVFAILSVFDVKNIYDNGQRFKSGHWLEKILYDDYKELIRDNPAYKPLRKGDVITLSNNATLKVLWPKSAKSPDINKNSLVSVLQYKGFKVLLPADSRVINKANFLSEHKDLRVNLLKIPHHGAPGSITKEALSVYDPSLVVICATYKDTEPVLGLLGQLSIPVYVVKDNGSLVVTFNKEMEEQWIY